jgi:ADP-heptose:LPS heptosyltransferase
MLKKILIYNSGGGLGDSIQLFPIILSLKNHFKGSTFFYLGAHQNHFNEKLKEFNINLNTIDLDLKFFGFRWWHLFKVKQKIKEKKIEKFDLIIDLQSKLRNTLILKQILHKNFYSSTFRYIFCTKKNKYLFHIEDLLLSTFSNLEIFLNEKIKMIEFDITMLDKKFIDESKRLLPENNYVGFSITQGNMYRKKSWKTENFINLAKKFISRGKKIVFFIEKSETNLIEQIKKDIPQALFPEHESNLSCPALVVGLASRLEKAITIDNGIMHMISLSNIPMVILFGPTDSKKFAPKRENVKILDSKKMYKSNDINKITVNDVLD